MRRLFQLVSEMVKGTKRTPEEERRRIEQNTHILTMLLEEGYPEWVLRILSKLPFI